ncbi:unnamed protein product [Taenia asiatica]|uniref:C2 domain-containing protein n=1 Tax=Taenia asiatica TaxID=60517 RepID=A0A158R909_TAEAS|nr:unnamed protein product [Taenia asiatica]
MNTLRGHLSHRIALRDRRERKTSTPAAFSLTRALHRSKAEAKSSDVVGPQRASYLSDTRSSSIKGSELALEADLLYTSVEDVLLGTNFNLSPDDTNANLSSTDYEREPGMLHRQWRGRLLNAKKRSRSDFNLYQLSPLAPQWMVELRIYTIYDINTSIVHDGTNTCIKIKQSGLTLGRTSVKPSSSHQVWEQTFSIPVISLRHPLMAHRLHMKQRSMSALNITDTSSSMRGPLNAGVQIFEARYLGILNLNVVSRPSNVYARRWTPLENQPGEVAVITNPLTKATETVSPRLPWPPHFMRGTSALEFDPVTGPQVGQFDSAVLYLNVLSACGLQSIPLSKFLNKFRTGEEAVDSVHRGVMVAKLISYSQTVVKQAQALSTQVQLQFGKDKYATGIRKSTYEPVWNQTFTFYLTRSSKTLIEIQLTSIANPNISGPASGIEKIGEALIDISRLPMDFTQRIEVELNGYRPKPRLLLLATLTGLAKDTPLQPPYSLPSITITSSFDSSGHQGDAESVAGSFPPSPNSVLPGTFNSSSDVTSPEGDDWILSPQASKENSSFDETDAQIVEHYGWRMALKNRFDVGFLRVSVIAASGLADKETTGTKCDPYCLLELINMRAQTHTVRKTLNPIWQKVFVFPITDIHSVLYITVKDEEKSKCEFLGRVAIPLMKIRNYERSWYALKSADLTERSRGSILLEFFFVYNHFKAAWRTLNPTETWLNHPVRPQKYKAMQANVLRLKTIFKPMGMVSQIVDDICSWENPWYTLITLVAYNAIVWNFQPYMIPLGMIVGILVGRKASDNPYLLDVISSAKVAAGVGASTLGPLVNHKKYLRPQGSQQSEDDPTSASPRTSLEYDSDVLISNELLSFLQQETPVEDKEQESEKHTTESKDPKQGKKKFSAIMDIIGDLPQIMDLIASAIEKTIGHESVDEETAQAEQQIHLLNV